MKLSRLFIDLYISNDLCILVESYKYLLLIECELVTFVFCICPIDSPSLINAPL